MATSDIKRGAVVEGVVIGRKSHSLDVMVGETRGTLRYDELNESTESACWARFEALVNGSRLWLKVLSVNPLKLTQRG